MNDVPAGGASKLLAVSSTNGEHSNSLYRVSVALEIPLRELTDVRADKPSAVPSEEAEKIFALVSGRRRLAPTSLQEYDQDADKESIRESAAILGILKYD